jgi:tRNA 5-methylaminomethyl-2-thiouridine biosynthesis bifunctional protein
MREPVQWCQDGTPRSLRFDDVYRTRFAALSQSSQVYLGGCRLPHVWQGRQRFIVLETGFGLGLNFLTTWAAWEADRQSCAELHFVSIEGFPVASADILRSSAALGGDLPAGALTALGALSEQLAQAWAGLRSGWQTLEFARGRVQLTLAVGPVMSMLEQWTGIADAVYLDGFSPAKNPDMWSDDVLAQVAARCRNGTTLASFSTQRRLREQLARLGFSVQRRPGVPPKRHRLEAVFGVAAERPLAPVLGAGDCLAAIGHNPAQ